MRMENDFLISADQANLDVRMIHEYLSRRSYWAKNIPLSIVQKSIECSFCFGVYLKNDPAEKEMKQVGFARVITDHSTFGYLADVFILDAYQGRGLGKMLMQFMMDHPDLQGFRRWLLATRDAHGLYAQFGFAALDHPDRIMGLRPLEFYTADNA